MFNALKQSFSCPDCNSNLSRFEEYQDLQTNHPRAVEQFIIDGSQFLAFDDWRYLSQPASYIYKLNNLTGKFALHQTILIRNAYDFEYFMIADKHYLGTTLYHMTLHLLFISGMEHSLSIFKTFH